MKFLIILIPILFLSCSKPEPIEIAYIATLSGKNSELGISGRTGVRMAVSEWNKNGGIDGRDIKLSVFDDGGTVSTGLKLIDTLKNRGISFVIGPLTSNMKPVVEAGMKEGILYVSPTMSSSSLSVGNDLFVRLIAPASYQSFLLQKETVYLDKKNILFLIDETNEEYTEDIYKSFMTAHNSSGSDAVIHRDYLKMGQRDRTRELPLIVDSLKADAVIVVANGIDFGVAAQYLRRSKTDFTLMGVRWATTSDVVMHGGKAVEGAILVGNIPTKNKSVKEELFTQKYRELHREEPSFIPLFTHDAVSVLLKGIQSAGSEEPEVVRDEIIKIGEFATIQGKVIIDSLGDAQRNLLELLTVENGEIKKCLRDR